MRINGIWVGWGLGDNSTVDFTVQRFKAFAKRMYHGYAGGLDDTNLFDPALYAFVVTMQGKLVADGHMNVGKFIQGVLDLPTQYASGFKKPPDKPKPIIFTVEGHMSDMNAGPCAFTAQALEQAGVCHHQPTGYDAGSVPFNDKSGFDSLVANLSAQRLGPNNVWPFPAGTPFGLIIFSQGAIIGCDVVEQMLLNNGPLAWRLPDLKRVLAFGNPRREENQCAPWVPDPPTRGTGGIADNRFAASTTQLAPIWREHSRHGDLYAENTTDSVGRDKTAIYKIVVNMDWIGGPSAMLARVMAMFVDPPVELFNAAVAIIEGIAFAANMAPHGQYDLGPCIEWMRGVAA